MKLYWMRYWLRKQKLRPGLSVLESLLFWCSLHGLQWLLWRALVMPSALVSLVCSLPFQIVPSWFINFIRKQTRRLRKAASLGLHRLGNFLDACWVPCWWDQQRANRKELRRRFLHGSCCHSGWLFCLHQIAGTNLIELWLVCWNKLINVSFQSRLLKHKFPQVLSGTWDSLSLS